MIDKIASRYHLLPSEVLERASTFDLKVLDIGMRYVTVAEQKRNGTYVPPVKKHTQEELMEILNKTKNGHKV